MVKLNLLPPSATSPEQRKQWGVLLLSVGEFVSYPMVSTVFNVTRWSALGAGIAYGFLHQKEIYSSAKQAAAQAQYNRKEKLIEQARAEWDKKNPEPAVTDGGPTANVDDPNFDPAKWIDAEVASLEK